MRIANKLPDVSVAQYWNNVAFTELFDASFYPTINCPAAVAELSAAENVLSGNSNAVTKAITSIENQDKKNLRSCPQLFATLRGRARLLEFCRYLRLLYPAAARIAIICDNFSPHLTTAKDN